MSTSLLYHAFGIRGYEYVRTQYQKGEAVFRIRHRKLDLGGGPISKGPLEGTNNKIKTMKRQAYGYRDQDCFKLKIMSVPLTRYALIG